MKTLLLTGAALVLATGMAMAQTNDSTGMSGGSKMNHDYDATVGNQVPGHNGGASGPATGGRTPGANKGGDVSRGGSAESPNGGSSK
jgi:hypothetical protein